MFRSVVWGVTQEMVDVCVWGGGCRRRVPKLTTKTTHWPSSPQRHAKKAGFLALLTFSYSLLPATPPAEAFGVERPATIKDLTLATHSVRHTLRARTSASVRLLPLPCRITPSLPLQKVEKPDYLITNFSL